MTYPLAHPIPRALIIAGCGKTTLYGAIKAGKLRARKLGRKTLILDRDLMAWLEKLPVLKPAVLGNPSGAADRGGPAETDEVT
jgi:excisionase family DNA binding protein